MFEQAFKNIVDILWDFVNQKRFPYLHGFKQRATSPNTIEYKIGEIFGSSLFLIF